MFVIREACLGDLEQIHRLAHHLDTVNLPDNRELLAQLLERSVASFSASIPREERELMFVLEDRASGELAGTSMIHAQHGTRKAPHIFFEVQQDERYSATLDRHFVHPFLRIGYNYQGPTEIGGLVVLPKYRGHPESLGRFLSYTRFLYIGMFRDQFRNEVLSELLPPLGEDGTSVLWESLGRHFTGLSYEEADRLSKHNKEFIRSLFPEGPLYTCLMSPDARQVIGQVGPQTKGVEKMLRAIGFKYANRIDPFDGGPHFSALTDEIPLIKRCRWAKVVESQGLVDGPLALIGCSRESAPHFFAARARVLPEEPASKDQGHIRLHKDTMELLHVGPGDLVGYTVL